MRKPWSFVMTNRMEHTDEKGHGALSLQGLEHGDEKGMEHFDEKAMEHSDDMCHGAL